MAEERPAPESFLDLVAEKRKGRLKIYVGAAAGVGKTWRMLEEAHELRDKGVDLVLGFIETHRRADTEDMVGDLEVIPRRKLDYRGVAMEEMDVDAILARKPEVAVVDELAHTNVAGSKHEKRYQDIEELLAAGINVITAMNIQHVESLNPMMKRLTGVDVRETVPDSFLARADQIVNVDVTVEALRERLREEREALQREGGRRTLPTERVMVGLSSNAHDRGMLLRKACRIAGQLGADWYAVHVETPSEAVSRVNTRDFVKLLDNINLAGDLGAETVWLKSDDIVAALLEFARGHGITKIVLGRTHQPLWRRRLKGDVTKRLLTAATDFDVEVVGGDSADEADKES